MCFDDSRQFLHKICILVHIVSKLTLFGLILDLDKAIKPKKMTIDEWLEVYKTIQTCFDDIWTSYVKKLHMGSKSVKIDPFRVNFGPKIAPLSPHRTKF